MARSEDLKTPLARFDWTKDLFVARAQEVGKKPKFGFTPLFPKSTDLSALKKAAAEAIVAEWGDKGIEWYKNGLIKDPFLDGDGPQGIDKKTGERRVGYAGHTFLRCTSGEDFKPVVVDRLRNPVVTVAGCPSGSYGFAVVHAFTWTNDKGGKGVTFGVSLVQVSKVAEGDERFSTAGGGSPDPDKYFEKIADEGAAPAETKNGQGAGALFS
jgi:hypothetical protein